MSLVKVESVRPQANPVRPVIERWVEALESGKYRQGRGYLNREGRFCCLGVLCELAADEGVVDRVTRVGLDGNYVNYGGCSAVLPDEVISWAGLASPNPPVRYQDTYGGDSFLRVSDLVFENDGNGRTFWEIANLIRTNYLDDDADV